MNESLADILKRCLEGDEEAAREIVARFHKAGADLARALLGDGHLAEDAVQEAFFTAFRRLPELRELQAFPGWFRQIVRTSAGRIRRGRKETVSDPTSDEPPTAPPSDTVERGELRETVRRALSELSEATRDSPPSSPRPRPATSC